MTDGWFVFAVVGGIVLLAGLVLAAAVFRAVWAQKEREAFTASDLRAVEESALLLIEQLKSEADRGISELQNLNRELRSLIAEADDRITALKSAAPTAKLGIDDDGWPVDTAAPALPVNTEQILTLASRGMDSVGIAKATGADCADIKVALKLGALASKE